MINWKFTSRNLQKQKCLDKINKLYSNLEVCDDEQKLEVINKGNIFSTPEEFIEDFSITVDT